MENTQQFDPSPSSNISGNNGIDVNSSIDTGNDYSAILFVIFIPLLVYFIGKYIYELTRPEPIQEDFKELVEFGKKIKTAFDKIKEFPKIIDKEIKKLFDKVKNWVMNVVNKVKESIMKFINKVKDGIMKFINQVKEFFQKWIDKIVSWFNKLWEDLACPFRLLGKFDLCLGNYGGDVLLYILYGLVYFITFIIYCFFYTVCKGICFFTGQFCIPFDPSKLCPSRHNIGQAIDFISVKGGYRFFDTFQLTTGKTFFYRDDRNIYTCYCTKPLRDAFDPLTTEFKMPKKPDPTAKSRAPIIIALSLSFLFFYNKIIK